MTDPSTQSARKPPPILDLFLISQLILFLELACIRWFPAHVLLLTFFTNVVLLACFLGMSVGCLAARRRRNYLAWTPLLLVVGLGSAHALTFLRSKLDMKVDVGGQQTNPQLVYFGAEYEATDAANFVVPIEAVLGFFFVVIALVMVGPGQELGRALTRLPNRVLAYTVNILGSLAGIVLFTLFSTWELSPFWWFLPAAAGVAYFLLPRPFARRPATTWWLSTAALLVALFLAGFTSGVHTRYRDSAWQYVVQSLRNAVAFGRPQYPEGVELTKTFWSPYYRVDYTPASRHIQVNLIGHQTMNALVESTPAYALPHLLNRDAGGKPFKNVLIIGAGSGNDVSRALQWGAERIDAVEIDPVIQRLGARDHPDEPFQDPRVTVHLDDGRNFLRSAKAEQYDLVIYALVDSLVLHSSYSNIRLESYLFTQEALQDVRRCLKKDGLFAMYNYYRQGWILARLKLGLEEVFGDDDPFVLTLPYLKTVDEESSGGFTLFFAGRTEAMRRAFDRHGEYRLNAEGAIRTDAPNGFLARPDGPPGKTLTFGIAEVVPPKEPLRTADDDWPFLYLRRPMIPDVSLRGAAVMGGLAIALILAFLPRGTSPAGRWGFDGRMFFLGAGFMLIETKAVVHMALLFGSTWTVNSVVFFAVLVMILAANLFVLGTRPQRLWPYYAGLLATLALNVALPLDFFLGMDRALQVVGSSLLVFAPILFAGVIFAASFARTTQPDLAFGANIAGAMLGGLAEYASMLLGFQGLLWVAIAFYGLSAVLGPKEQAFDEPASPGG
jgi:SAM-dependent methyltransferase